MIKRKHGPLMIIFLLSLILAVSGCGNTAVHEQLNDKEGDRTVIRIAWWGEEERNDVTEQILELYSQLHPEIMFEMESSSWNDYYERLLLETVKGQMPDLIQMDYQYLQTYSENGSLADLASFIEDGIIKINYIDENMLGSGVIGGRYRGIALGSTTLSMIYNMGVFDEAGIPYPDAEWTWKDFTDICMQIKKKTGKYGVAMTPVLDLNLYHYWVRQHGEELFSEDQRSIGYMDDDIYIGYVEMFKNLMDIQAAPNPAVWAEIDARGNEQTPVLTGECGMAQEWSNFLIRMRNADENLKMITPPMAEGSSNPGLWMKPSMFFSVAETSAVKEECARFIDWFLNSKEANEILKGERGIPVSVEIRNYLLEDEALSEMQREMFCFADEAKKLCGDTPPPEPPGIEKINDAFSETATACFYDVITAKEAAAEFREKVNTILAEYKE